MNEPFEPFCATFDKPEILARVFHPRSETTYAAPGPNCIPLMIPVQKDISVGACFHSAHKKAPIILFFHGNGEIVADYHDIGPLYTQMGINFLPVDFRGYGRSGGNPTFAGMMHDCGAILDFATEWLQENEFTGHLVVMGRSLGSASALELAAQRQDEFSGMILESGFAYGAPLLRLLGVRVEDATVVEEKGFRHIQKIKAFQKPVLIIHAEYDHIIPYTDGLALYKASAAQDKSLLKIEGANHNDILLRGFDSYMQAIQRLMLRIATHQK